jgi:predicted phage terminase large subunit-like protein
MITRERMEAASPVFSLQLPYLRPDQSAIVRDPAKVKLVAMGRRWGKTVLAIVVALACASQGGRVAWVAPTYKNSRALWRAAENAALRSRNPYIRPNRNEHLLEFLNCGGALAVYSADNPDAIRSEAFNLVIGDECARFPEGVWTEVLYPTLADMNGDAILISTPKGRNWFYRTWVQGLEDGVEYKSWRAPTIDNPSLAIQEAYRRAKLRLPPRAFSQEWEAEFVEDSATVFSSDWWRNRNRYFANDARLAQRVIRRWVSFDTAMKDKTTSDYTACVVAELLPDYRLLVREVWRERLSFPNLVAAIEHTAEHYNRDNKLEGVIIEDTISGTSAYQTIVASTTNRRLARLMIAYRPSGSKGQRASLAGVWCMNGCVLLPYPGPAVPWLYNFEQELYAFSPIDSENEFDDQVDALSQMILYLESVRGVLSNGYAARVRAAKLREAR